GELSGAPLVGDIRKLLQEQSVVIAIACPAMVHLGPARAVHAGCSVQGRDLQPAVIRQRPSPQSLRIPRGFETGIGPKGRPRFFDALDIRKLRKVAPLESVMAKKLAELAQLAGIAAGT